MPRKSRRKKLHWKWLAIPIERIKKKVKKEEKPKRKT
jgi:hypothetical protein